MLLSRDHPFFYQVIKMSQPLADWASFSPPFSSGLMEIGRELSFVFFSPSEAFFSISLR